MVATHLEDLERRIGHTFRNQALLVEALTHSSCVQEGSGPGTDNELLEFLGDAVLSFFVTGRLFREFRDSDEGKLSLSRASLVSASHLKDVALALGLGDYLRMGPAEEKTGGRQKASILADGLEALLGAVYLDGGTKAAQKFVERFVIPKDLAEAMEDFISQNHKGVLQEFLQSEGRGPAEYRVVKETGLEHQKVFTVEVTTGDSAVACGEGTSKKAAEQQAAKNALGILLERSRNNG
jgi:ribonuclease III